MTKKYHKTVIAVIFILAAARNAYVMATGEAQHKSAFVVMIAILLALLFFFLRDNRPATWMMLFYTATTGLMNIILGFLLAVKGEIWGLPIILWGGVFLYATGLLRGCLKAPETIPPGNGG